MIVSMRRRSGDPRKEAFTDLTYALLEELRSEQRTQGVQEIGTASGVLIASDYLIATASESDEIRWDRFDVAELCTWLANAAPGLVAALPEILLDLAIFTDFLAETGRCSRDRADDVAAALDSVVEALESVAPPNRAARRAAKRARRRGN